MIKKFPNFFSLLRGGERGSEQIRTFTLFILFIFFLRLPLWNDGPTYKYICFVLETL